MTDEQIIKALEYCSTDVRENTCPKCAFYKKHRCSTLMLNAVSDLINRQKAEIERLKEEKQDIKDKYDCQQTVYCDLSDIIKEKCKELELANADKVIAESHEKAAKKMFVDVVQRLKTIKSEAIKEFAEKLTDKISVYSKYVDVDGIVILNRIFRMIKDIEKEMTEVEQ